MDTAIKAAKKVQNQFNDLANSLGCRARIGGTMKSPKFFEWTGGETQGFEVWRPIPVERFVQLTNKYPQLQD